MKKVLEQEGIEGFYSGVSSTMLGQALIKGVVFLTYDVAKRWLPATPWGLSLAACVSGAFGGLVCTPVERVKVVMQAGSAGDYRGGPDCLKQILAEDGFDGLMTRGLGATLLREIPAYFFYFSAYEVACATLGGLVAPGLLPLIGGAAAGAASWIPVYPVDVVKTALQSEVGNAGGGSAISVAKSLYSQGGVAVFWDGITPKLLRAVVNHAVTFAVFEKICALYVLAT